MGSLDRRIGALEGYVQRRVEVELEAILDRVQEHLSRDEYRRVLEIMVSDSAAERARWRA